MMKKIAVLLVSAALMSIVSCKKENQTPADVPVTGVELDITEIGLEVGQMAVLTATVLPEDATDKTVTWSSSAPEIVSVDEDGTIEALAAGNATVTVTTSDGKKTAECNVGVIPDTVPVTGVELNTAVLHMNVGETATLTATVLPEDATDKTVTWSSSAPEIASVDENGTVEGLVAGNSVITVTTADGGKTAECNVQVSPVAVTGVELDITELEIEVGETATLTATVLPEDATDKTVTWSSSTPEIASVNENGTVEGLVAGNSVITVTTADGGKTAECNVMVTPTINGHEYVDLGLSVKWATCNVGAENPYDYGDHFAWGETEPKEEYTIDNSVTYGIDMTDISGNPEYDAATANWGGTWRIPDEEEITQLINECTWEWTTENENNGYKVTGPNGNSIFLPITGFRLNSQHNLVTVNGYYWSSVPDESDTATAYGFYFGSSFYNWDWVARNFGRCVRPVSD